MSSFLWRGFVVRVCLLAVPDLSVDLIVDNHLAVPDLSVDLIVDNHLAVLDLSVDLIVNNHLAVFRSEC